MFSLLLRQYDTVGELMRATENTYIVDAKTKADVEQMWTSLSRIRSLLWSAERLSQELVTVLQQFADLKFSTSFSRQASRTTKEKSPITPKVFANSIRKSPLYHNCQLEAPDGQLLCTSDEKKALWYVSKGLGYKVSEDPLTVRLNFEPSGRPEGTAGEYYLR